MKFEQWWDQYRKENATMLGIREDFMAAWQAATLAEREACAKMCDAQAERTDPKFKAAAKYCADMIRATSAHPEWR